MLVKVCGMKKENQVNAISSEVDFIGYIFYKKSKRYTPVAKGIKQSKRVGVFVNALRSEIIKKVESEKLDFVQLHGDESPSFCLELKVSVPIIKAFGIDENFDFSLLDQFINCVDFFLFDTKINSYGGSGKQFNWKLLERYNLNKSFFLSGGISPKSIQQIKSLNHPKCIGIDINSGFEDSPGDKNINQIKTFIYAIKS